VDAGTGRIEAVELTASEVDDRSRVGPLLDQMDGAVAERHPAAAVVVPPRRDAVPSEAAATAPTQRDRHLQLIVERGRLGWQSSTTLSGSGQFRGRSMG
jgi:hypothetical protein